MRDTLLILLILVFQNTFGQFGVINDKDGIVNVRKSPQISNNIIDTLHNGQIVFYYEEPKGDWYGIDYEDGKYANSGYMHKSRLKFITEFESVPLKNRAENKVIFQKDSLKITMTKVPFIINKNKLLYGEGNQSSFLKKINDKEYWGSDGGIPTTQYGQISIEWGEKRFALPKESVEDLFEPNFEDKYTSVFFDFKSNTIYIIANNSDGAGGYSVLWIIENGKFKRRYLSNAYA